MREVGVGCGGITGLYFLALLVVIAVVSLSVDCDYGVLRAVGVIFVVVFFVIDVCSFFGVNRLLSAVILLLVTPAGEVFVVFDVGVFVFVLSLYVCGSLAVYAFRVIFGVVGLYLLVLLLLSLSAVDCGAIVVVCVGVIGLYGLALVSVIVAVDLYWLASATASSPAGVVVLSSVVGIRVGFCRFVSSAASSSSSSPLTSLNNSR